jgi:hypothetical protein
MNKSALRALDVEALTFIYTPVATSRSRGSPWGASARSITVGAAVMVVVAGALGWFLSR